ncbi:oxygen-dependent tRNA uridine(34) hydroxylase TrhO [Rhodoflexus sp.]
MEHAYNILLYYCYTQIADPELFRDEHHELCLSLNLRGRIIVAAEGLNGTVSGLKADTERYMEAVKADPRFAGIDFKVEPYHKHAFAKLHVRVKPEIVHSDLHHINPMQKTGVHLSPSEFKQLKDAEDVVILDVRSNYEHAVGKFKNAVTLDIENFRDFPKKISELEQFKGKKIITYCTGGIKCEKASAYLLEQGFDNVYQLHGGIIKYAIEEGGEDFEGKCYVFDGRVVADVNKVNPKIISKCYICGIECDRMVNCANADCNIHVPICEKCGWEMEGACSTACKAHPRKRPYDGTGYYAKATNGYNPYLNAKRAKKKVSGADCLTE